MLVKIRKDTGFERIDAQLMKTQYKKKKDSASYEEVASSCKAGTDNEYDG